MRPQLRFAAAAGLMGALLAAGACRFGSERDRPVPADFHLRFVGEFESGFASGTTSLALQERGSIAVLLNENEGFVDVIDLANPAEPEWTRRHELRLAPGERATSVAVHPRRAEILVTVSSARPGSPGRLQRRRLDQGDVFHELAVGHDPVRVALDSQGRFAVVANQGERFLFDSAERRFATPPGSVTVIELADSPEETSVTQVELTDAEDAPGLTEATDERSLGREVDWNGNGQIDAEVDFDGNGAVEDVEVLVGTFDDEVFHANERRGERFAFPVRNHRAPLLEPRRIAFSPDGHLAYVTLPANNGVVVINTVRAVAVRTFGLGRTKHSADLRDDGSVTFVDELVALREPEGLAVTPDGRYFVTADAGTTLPETPRPGTALPDGGGRTLSVFDARTGQLVGDTASGLDLAAHAAGLYDDGRSALRGVRPTDVVTFVRDELPWCAVTLTDGDAVALVSLSEPESPRVISTIRTAPAPERAAPVVLDVQRTEDGRLFLHVANSARGTVTVLEVVR